VLLNLKTLFKKCRSMGLVDAGLENQKIQMKKYRAILSSGSAASRRKYLVAFFENFVKACDLLDFEIHTPVKHFLKPLCKLVRLC